MFAPLTPRSDTGLFSTRRGTADAQGREYSDRNRFESDRADIGSFRRLQSKLERFLLATVGHRPDELGAD